MLVETLELKVMTCPLCNVTVRGAVIDSEVRVVCDMMLSS